MEENDAESIRKHWDRHGLSVVDVYGRREISRDSCDVLVNAVRAHLAYINHRCAERKCPRHECECHEAIRLGIESDNAMAAAEAVLKAMDAKQGAT